MRYVKNREFILSSLTGFALLFVSIMANAYAVQYAARTASNSVTDIILSNIPVYNVDGIFVYGAVLLILCIVIACLSQPKSIPFVLKSISLFVLIRSFFVSLTHISPYPEHVTITQNIFTTLFPSIFLGDDLFFSGHAGLPFLMTLIFWNSPIFRVLFITFSVLLSATVLLGHLHYSIDVASAFFITTTIFAIARSIFKKDWELFKSTSDAIY
ncbi:MAG: phosphatase PAP2-related protein [Minisyncoccia bacterium]